MASLVVEHRLQTHRLSSCGSRAQLLHGMRDLGTILDVGHLMVLDMWEKNFYSYPGMVSVLFFQLISAFHVTQNLEAWSSPVLDHE